MADLKCGYACLQKLTVLFHLKPSTTFFRHFTKVLKGAIWFEQILLRANFALFLSQFAPTKAKKKIFQMAGSLLANKDAITYDFLITRHLLLFYSDMERTGLIVQIFSKYSELIWNFTSPKT
jgi:hypothetical protein